MEKIPFVCSLSRLLREAVKHRSGTADRIKNLAASLVEQFDNDPELCKSLGKKEGTAKPVKFPILIKERPAELRQVDLRDHPGGTIFLKAFLGWNNEINCWHVFVEGPDETDIEQGIPNWTSELEYN